MSLETQRINRELMTLSPDTLVELFTLDATHFQGGEFFRFVPDSSNQGQDLIWQGFTFTRYPCEVTGFEMKGQGQLPRPKIRFSNVSRLFTNLTLNFFDLVGSRITRHRTFYKYLDDQPTSDPNAAFPDDIFFIERKTVENKHLVEFELASILDVEGLLLPRRQVIAGMCPWKYRGAECGFSVDRPIATITDEVFTGNVRDRDQWSATTVFEAGDFCWVFIEGARRQYYYAVGGPFSGESTKPPNPAYWKSDQCGKRLLSCKLRYGEDTPLPYGGFPGTSRMPF